MQPDRQTRCRYKICIEGHIHPAWLNSAFELETCLETEADSGRAVTLLVAVLPDEAALHGLLNLIRDRNLRLISVQRLAPSNA